MSFRGTAVVTGASSGIGAASVLALAQDGWRVVAGARREDRLREVAEVAGARWARLDVTDQASVDAFVAGLGECSVLVNNAGGAFGLGPIAEADEDQWRRMYEVNVLGLMRMTRALLPLLERASPGHIVNIGSIAASETYPGGGGYTAVKHGVRAVSRTLRQELLGRPVRVTEIDPGAVETEFSLVRLGSEERAAAVYAGMTPLSGADIAECVRWVVDRPAHVNVDELLVRPIDQVMGQPTVHRRDRPIP
jgi:NADP-dependent 3-hydroxy acid dehydrogenase YdfG